jgi:hypothetical protein
MLLFAAALAGMFSVVPRFFLPGARAKSWVRGLGMLAVLALVAVPLTPSERYGNLHAVLALTSGALGISAAVAAVGALLVSSRRARALGALGALALTVGAFDGVLLVQHLGEAAPPPLLLPAAQKVAALLVSAWIATVALLVVLEEGSVKV